jgi:GNAT superfamily N-acetyltransferase
MPAALFHVLAPESALHDAALDHTYPLWHDSLTREQYGRYNRAQFRTAWGATHLDRVGLVADGALLASAKRYRLRLRLDGRTVGTIGIGAVFTPPHLRGRGHAAALIGHIVEAARGEGASMAILFSEIAPRYYERLGFSVVPTLQATIGVRTGPGAPAVLVRAGQDGDSAHVAEMLVRRLPPYRFGLVHDPDLVTFSVTKKRLLAGFDQTGRRTVEYFVTEEGYQAVAFVLLQVTEPERTGLPIAWSVAACGDRDASGARVGAMLQVLLARHPGDVPPIIRAWWPVGMTPPQLSIARRGLTAEVMMIRTLDPTLAIDPWLAEGDTCYWHGDAF